MLFLDLPKLTVIKPKRMLDLRADAQAHGVDQFWEMIEHEYQLAQAQGQPNVARAEKIRADFEKWLHGRYWMRGYSLSLGLITTLAVYAWGPQGLGAAAEGILLGAAASSIPAWFGELNAGWVGLQRKDRKAFRCMSRIDRKLS